MRELARIIWYGSLSSSDLASIGMTQNTNPFQFRKLVFWATAANIDLNRYAGEIDAVIDNVVQIAQSYKKRAEQRKAERSKRRNTLDKLIERVIPLDEGDTVKSIIDLIDPAGATGGGPWDLLHPQVFGQPDPLDTGDTE